MLATLATRCTLISSLAMSARVLKALPGKLDFKKHSPSILYLLIRNAKLSMRGRLVKNVQIIRCATQEKGPYGYFFTFLVFDIFHQAYVQVTDLCTFRSEIIHVSP